MKTFITFLTLTVSFYLTAQTQLITNGNFDQSTGWITIGDFVYNTSNPQYNFDPGYAYTSNTNNSFGQLQQGITIPATSTSVTLTLYHKISTDETTSTNAYDVCGIEIVGASSSTLLKTLSNLDASSSYVSYTTTIPSLYFGQTVSLFFSADNDGGKPTRFRFDNISVIATLSSGGSVDITTWNNNVDSTSIFPGNRTMVSCDHGYQSGSLSSSTSLYVGYYLSSDQLLDGGDVLLDDDRTTLSSSNTYDSENDNSRIPSSTLPGNYYILFVADMNDDVSESNENNNVVGVPITVKGTTPSTGSLTVTITPSAAINDGALWQLNNGGIWHNSGSTLNLSPGVYTVSYKTISGWNTPPAQTLTVVSGGLISTTGAYTSNVLTPTVKVTNPSIYACYIPGASLNITATITGTITGKKIELTTDGISWTTINSWTTSNTALSYPWTIPNVNKPTYFQIKVTAFSTGGAITDVSEICIIMPLNSTFTLNEINSHLYWPFEVNSTSWNNPSFWYPHDLSSLHNGWDFNAQDWVKKRPGITWGVLDGACDRDFHSPLRGVVLFVRSNYPDDCKTTSNPGGGGYGNYIVIQSLTDPNYIFLVGHLNNVYVVKGDTVKVHDLIGEVGSTGTSTGPHAHCALYKNVYQDVYLPSHNLTINLFDIFTTSPHIRPVSQQELDDTKMAYATYFDFRATSGSGGGGINIPENKTEQFISVSPNPNNGVFEITSTELMTQIELFTLQGKRLLTKAPDSKFLSLKVTNLSQGSYFLRIHTKKGITTNTLVVQ